LGIVPVHGDPAIQFGFPVDGDTFIGLSEHVEELVNVWLVGIVDGKIINNKSKLDGLDGVAPMTGVVVALVPAMFGETFF
jgi:hypothetical protein